MAGQVNAKSVRKPTWVSKINPVNWIMAVVRFVRDSFKEMKRVTWPSKEKVMRSTAVVIGTVILITLFIWGVDTLFHRALGGFLNLLGI